MTFWKPKPSLPINQARNGSGQANWLDRLTNDADCHFDPYEDLTFDELAERIATHGGIPLPSSTSSFIPTHGIKNGLHGTKIQYVSLIGAAFYLNKAEYAT